MCGIAGIIGRLDEGNRAALQRMNDAMVHRGPDAGGTWTSTPDARGWGALLAHRRLAILDLSPAGAQPMVDPVTGHVITFNGEIYNYRDLRRRLIAEGQEFKSTGDTAVMLRALGLHGPAGGELAARHVRFRVLGRRNSAGCCWRETPWASSRSTSLARRIANANWSIAFASELRALLASGLLGTPHLDPQCRRQRRVERLRGGADDSRQRCRTSLARAACRIRRLGQRGPPRGFLAHPDPRSRSHHG